MHPARLTALILLTACATTPSATVEPARVQSSETNRCPGPRRPTPQREHVLEFGGELNLDAPQESVRAGKKIHIVAMIEVPGDTRLQPALAMADAQVRAELTKSIRVGIASAFSERVKVGDTETQTITRATAEVTNGVLPALPAPEHGWRRIDRNDTVVLQVVSRLSADQKALVDALHHALKDERHAESLALRAANLIGVLAPDQIGTQKETP